MNPDRTGTGAALGHCLRTNKWAQVAELVCVFLIPCIALGIIQLLNEPSPFMTQAIIAVAMILMIGAVWLGLRLRGQRWNHFGLAIGHCEKRRAVVAILQSGVVFVAALAAFVVGAIVMQVFVGRPGGADLSGYDRLQGNLPLLLITLLSVYITASFGEEVLYRGFLMTRLAELLGDSKAAWRTALAASSVVFGLIHFHWGPTGVVQTGLMGLALGTAYLLVRRNLWVTILAHGYLDTMLILPLYFAGPE